MSNPYKAPKARVENTRQAELEPRPVSIDLALVLITLFVLVECYHQVMRLGDVNNGELSGLRWLVDWIWVVVIVVTAVLIARGKSWSRWVLLALALYDLYELADALLFMSMFEAGTIGDFIPVHSRVMLWIGPLCATAATILVFGPGRGWLRR
jgi:hypothetical protein